MTKQELFNYIEHGRVIEFIFQSRKYSITYGIIEGKEVISFCEFYQETTEVETAEELINVTREGVTVLQMLESLTEEDIWIY